MIDIQTTVKRYETNFMHLFMYSTYTDYRQLAHVGALNESVVIDKFCQPNGLCQKCPPRN